MYWNERNHDVKLNIIKPHLSDHSMKILNIGNTGDNEIFNEKVRTCAPGHNVTQFIIDDTGDVLPYNDNSFELVMSLFVLEHIPNKRQILEEIIRVSHDKIIIMTDTTETQKDMILSSMTGKQCLYSANKWIKIFTKMGLIVKKIVQLDAYKYNVLYPVSRCMFVLKKNEEVEVKALEYNK